MLVTNTAIRKSIQGFLILLNTNLEKNQEIKKIVANIIQKIYIIYKYYKERGKSQGKIGVMNNRAFWHA